MARRVQSSLEANGGHFQHMLWCHISHTTNVLLFKFRCYIIIGVRIIKEMPGLVGLCIKTAWSSTFCSLLRSLVTSSLSGPNIFFRTLLSDTHSSRSSFNLTLQYLYHQKVDWTQGSTSTGQESQQGRLAFKPRVTCTATPRQTLQLQSELHRRHERPPEWNHIRERRWLMMKWGNIITWLAMTP
jgi:hypothetical protein